MRKRVIPFDCTAEEMDKGFGMKYHPVSGDYPKPLDKLRFDEAKQMFAFQDSNMFFPRIGDGEEHSAGMRYLHHWSYCPFTGEPLFDLSKNYAFRAPS